MKKVYSEELLKKYQHELKISWILAIVFLVILYVPAITLAFFLNDNNFNLFVFLMILSSSIGGIVFFFILFSKINPISKRIKFINSLKNKRLLELSGEVISISNEITIAAYVNVYEVKLQSENKVNVVYFDSNEIDNIKENMYLTCLTYQYQVIEYETK